MRERGLHADVIRGHARLAGPGVVDVDFLTNSSLLDLDELPEHLVIIGASYIGLEVVQMLLTAMYARAPDTVIARGVYIHPTVSELIPTTLQSLRPLDPV